MQHIFDQPSGNGEPSMLETPQRHALMAASSLSDRPYDRYSFSRVGNSRLAEGGARSSTPPQLETQYQDNLVRLGPGVFPFPHSLSQPSTTTQAPHLPYTSSSRHALSVAFEQTALIVPPSTGSAPGTPSATDFILPVPPPANVRMSSEAIHAAVTPFASQVVPSTPQGSSAWGYAHQPVGYCEPPSGSDGQRPHCEHGLVPTDKDVDNLYAFFYNDHGWLPPHAVSSYSSLAGALSEPGPPTSRAVHPLQEAIGGLQAATTHETSSRKLPPPSTPVALPFRSSVHLDQDRGQLQMTTSAVTPMSAGPSPSRKRKSTAPPSGGTEHDEKRARRRNKRRTKGKETAVEPEPESGSAEAIRSRKRRDHNKGMIHALYDGVAGFIKLDPLETLSLDDVLQLTVDFLKSRKEMELQRDEEVQALRDALREARSQLRPDDTHRERIPLDWASSQEQVKIKMKESETLRAALGAKTVESQQNGEKVGRIEEEARRNGEDAHFNAEEARCNAEKDQRNDEEAQRKAKESQRHAEETRRNADRTSKSAQEVQQIERRARQFEAESQRYKIQAQQSQGLAEHYSDLLMRKEHELASVRAVLQRYQETFGKLSMAE
ncbi:hypothetical protein DENSPDRAFT_533547 [Dentipellis sp. KUC8613]|nr:hypothetical protein DENSPDRAFT_533547 [Dentipellis sp. KUC8613]